MDYSKRDKRGTLVLDQLQARNLATGIGQTVTAAEHSGAARSQRVIDAAPADQLHGACGYPEPTPEFGLVVVSAPSNRAARQKTIR